MALYWLLVPIFAIAGKKPNIVFIISDQHKKKALGCYGDDIAITPHIDALAENGVMLNNCYAAAPVSAPSRAALTTGMYPEASGAPYHKAPVEMKNGKVKNLGTGLLRETGYHLNLTSLPDIFRQHGYVTGAPGKMHVHGELQKNVDPDFPEGNDMGYDSISVRYYTHFPGGHYEDIVGRDTYERYRVFGKYKHRRKNLNLNQYYQPTLVKDDEDNFDMVVTRKSVEFIEERADDGKNFFLHVGLEKPHPPFTTTQKYLDMYNPEDFELPETAYEHIEKGKFPWVPKWIHNGLPRKPENAKNAMASYYACVTQVDDMVGRIVKSLKENDLYDNTIIIYTSDHGEHLLEKGLRGKHCMYDAAIKVPFVISYPPMFPKGESNDALVTLIDMMPTFCDIMGWKTPETAQGVSVLPYLKTGKEIPDRAIFAEFRGHVYQAYPDKRNIPSRMMRNGDYKFIYTHGIINQLYDVKNDPEELNNLALSDDYNEMERDFCFQTITDWEPLDYNLIELKQNSGILKWNGFEQAESYAVYHSETKNASKARVVAKGLQKKSYKVKTGGYYWVMAIPELKRTAPRTGKTPVFLEEYTMQLPVSKCVELTL